MGRGRRRARKPYVRRRTARACGASAEHPKTAPVSSGPSGVLELASTADGYAVRPDRGRQLVQILRADPRVDAEQLAENIRVSAVAGAAIDIEVLITGKNETYIVLSTTASSSHAVRHRQRTLDCVVSAILDQPDLFALNWASVLERMR